MQASALAVHGRRLTTSAGLILAISLTVCIAPAVRSDCVPPPSGLVAWWALDETEAGLAVNRAGLPYGFHSGNATPGPGVVANGVHLPGTGPGFVSIPDHPAIDLGQGDFSIDAWVYWNNSFDSKVRTIVDKREGNLGYALYRGPAGQMGFHMGDAQGFTNYMTPDTRLFQHTWNFGTVTVDRVNHFGRFFVNGGFVFGFDPRTGNLSNSQQMRLGMAFDTDFTPFDGIIDEVEIFNRELGFGEVAQLYAAGSAGKCKTVGVEEAHSPRSAVLDLANNPLRSGHTEVHFTLEREGRATIRVYDLAGRLVHHRDTEDLAAGEHHVAWNAMGPDGTPIPNGLYFVKVSLGSSGLEATRRLVVAR